MQDVLKLQKRSVFGFFYLLRVTLEAVSVLSSSAEARKMKTGEIWTTGLDGLVCQIGDRPKERQASKAVRIVEDE